MKTFNCPHCQQPISPQAKSCPGCGHPIRLNANRKSYIYIIIALIVGGWIIYTAFQKMHAGSEAADKSLNMLLQEK